MFIVVTSALRNIYSGLGLGRVEMWETYTLNGL